MNNDDILKALLRSKGQAATNPTYDDSDDYVTLARGGKSKWTKEQLNGKPVSGNGHPGYFTGKKLDREKFCDAINLYLSGKGVSQVQCAKMCGLSTPTFMKYANELYSVGYIDGSRFKDGISVQVVNPADVEKSNDYIFESISREG